MSEELSDIIGDDCYEPEDFKFDIREVLAFNRSENPNHICIRMKSGFDIIITIEFNEFERIHEEVLK